MQTKMYFMDFKNFGNLALESFGNILEVVCTSPVNKLTVVE